MRQQLVRRLWAVCVILAVAILGVEAGKWAAAQEDEQAAPQAATKCAALGKSCTKPNTSNPPCCAPNTCDPTAYKCVAPTTTTVPTTTSSSGAATTTTTSSEATTTSTPAAPPNAGYSFLYLPADLGLLLTKFGASCQFTGDIMDPRTGSPADQMMLTAMAWQYQQYSMELVAAADSVGCPWNSVQIEDANFKFGADYWLLHQPFPVSGTYQQLQPTYVRQYTCAPIVAVAQCLQAKHALSTDLAQVAGITPGPTSPPPLGPPNGITDGILVYTTGHYPPLTAHQCALLQAAEDAHMAHDQSFLDHDFAGAAANNQAVLNTQRAFEGSAETLEQATLFKWTWQGNYNHGNPQDVLDGLTRGIMKAHAAQTAAFNCASGTPPDSGRILHYRFQHNFWHDCRASVHWLDTPMPTVCDGTQIESCPRMTCRQQAALL
jgi:hypothetical protein